MSKQSIIFIIVGILGFSLIVWGLYELGNSSKPLTNQQIVEQINYCKKHGFGSERFIKGLTGETAKIECRDKE